jgi:hypothetical protein
VTVERTGCARYSLNARLFRRVRAEIAGAKLSLGSIGWNREVGPKAIPGAVAGLEDREDSTPSDTPPAAPGNVRPDT